MQSEVLAPAVKGTLNILQACSANDVQKVVVVSSTAAVHFNPKWPQDIPKDENCWSDINFCEKNEVLVSQKKRAKSDLRSRIISKIRFSTINYKTGQHRPSNSRNRINLFLGMVLKVVCIFLKKIKISN